MTTRQKSLTEAGFAKKLPSLPREPEGISEAPKPVPSSAGLKPFSGVSSAESQHWPLASPLVRVPSICYSQEAMQIGSSSREEKTRYT